MPGWSRASWPNWVRNWERPADGCQERRLANRALRPGRPRQARLAALHRAGNGLVSLHRCGVAATPLRMQCMQCMQCMQRMQRNATMQRKAARGFATSPPCQRPRPTQTVRNPVRARSPRVLLPRTLDPIPAPDLGPADTSASRAISRILPWKTSEQRLLKLIRSGDAAPLPVMHGLPRWPPEPPCSSGAAESSRMGVSCSPREG
jgi:hypothetical protein